MVRALVETPLGASLLFLVANVVFLLLILLLNKNQVRPLAKLDPLVKSGEQLDASDVLGWEFEYARTTASEALGERHTLVNFYLLVAGIVVSGVVAALGRDTGLSPRVGTLLLWALCVVGWVDFLAIVRLRQAWHDSARTMNQIKKFYFCHAKCFRPEELREAFRWKPETLPRPDKPFTIFFYSCLLISLINSGAFVIGGMLLGGGTPKEIDSRAMLWLPIFGLAFLAFHMWLYFDFLKPTVRPAAKPAKANDTEGRG
jgi:hypothetical protein